MKKLIFHCCKLGAGLYVWNLSQEKQHEALENIFSYISFSSKILVRTNDPEYPSSHRGIVWVNVLLKLAINHALTLRHTVWWLQVDGTLQHYCVEQLFRRKSCYVHCSEELQLLPYFFITVTIKCLYFLLKYSSRCKRYPSSAPSFPNGLRQRVDKAQILHRMLFLTAIFLFIPVCNRHYDYAAVWPQRQGLCVWPQRQGLCVLPVLGWGSFTWKVNTLNTEPWSHFTYCFLNICVYNQIYDADIDVPVE